MKSIILVALALVAAAAAAPAEKVIDILQYNNEQQANGGYEFSYESEDGSKREEQGVVKEAFDEENKPHQVVVIRGSYSYPGEDGKPVFVTYQADENGYKAEGDSIPKPARR